MGDTLENTNGPVAVDGIVIQTEDGLQDAQVLVDRLEVSALPYKFQNPNIRGRSLGTFKKLLNVFIS